MTDVVVSPDELVERARALDETYGHNAGRYDKLVVFWRGRATTIELVVAILMVGVGAGGSVGAFNQVSALYHSPEATSVMGWVLALLPMIASIVVGLATAYIGVVNPRGKQSMFGAASESCASLATAARVVSKANLNGATESVWRNLVNSVLTSLESSAVNDMPPLAPEKTKKTD